MIFRFMNSQNAKRARGPEETIFVDLNQEKDDPFGFSQTMRDRDPRTKTYWSRSKRFGLREIRAVYGSLMRESKYLKVRKEDCTDISDLGPDLPNGNINWDCSCMGSQPFGPCGKSFQNSRIIFAG